MKQNLTLENFWNDLHKNHPAAVQIFCDWIDNYKAENNWNVLFNAGAISRTGDTVAPKYHDLPYAMQLGIWIEFVDDFFTKNIPNINYKVLPRRPEKLREMIVYDIYYIEKSLS